MMSGIATQAYTDIYEVQSELGLVQDANNNWLLWQVPVNVEVLQHHVDYANIQTTRIASGDIGLAKLYATKYAALHIVQEMAVGWQISGLQANLGNVSINRLPAMQAAAALVIPRLEADLRDLYQKMCSIDTVQGGLPQSPYIVTGGSSYWP